MQASGVARLEPGRSRNRPPDLVAAPECDQPASLKSRYRIREEGGVRLLICVEAPTVRVRIQPGVTATAQEARRAPPGTIFVDGAAQGAPFTDPVKRIYNLDHHQGCVRSFTLSACEQAMVLVCKGLELRSREWTVHANDADLDAVLAIWVLLNHLRLSDPAGSVRADIMPLLRLEGAIDAQGLDLQDLCALPPALFEQTRRRMDRLLDHERNLKSNKSWHRVDQLEYVRERLAQIDRLVYPASVADELVDIEELGRIEICEGNVALVCRARAGIYEVERELRRLHGPRLGLIALMQRSGVYTLRQVNPALPGSLEAVYQHLNLIDSAAGSPQSGNRWGGSEEIGGSPRETGSKLSVQQLLDGCRHAFAPTSFGRRLAGLARAMCTTAIVLSGSIGAAAAMGTMIGLPDHVTFGYALACVAGFAFLIRAARTRCAFGLRMPRGSRWLRTLPIAVSGALVGGTGLVSRSLGDASPLLGLEAALPWLGAIVGTELLFRGLVQGQLVWAFGPTPTLGSAAATTPTRKVWLSPPVLAACLSSAAGFVVASPDPGLIPSPGSLTQMPMVLAGALTLGLAAGFAREQSGSVLASIAVHAAAAAAVALAVIYS
jgi:membrane protease YdiL (CAAX protease family)